MSTLTSITISPSSASMHDDGYVQLTITGHFDDSTSRALAVGEAFLESSDDTVAYFVTTTTAWFGRLYGSSPGSVTVTAIASTYTATASVTVTAHPALTAPGARFSLAFSVTALDPYPTWTAIDTHPNLVTSYTIDRGRTYELDQMNGGTATVNIIDPDGILDPTNPAGPYYGQIRPLLQAVICRHNPVSNTWEERYRGFVETYSYEVDPSQQVNKLTVSLVDLFDICGSAEMHPGQFGNDGVVPDGIHYGGGHRPDQRMAVIVRELGIPDRMWVGFRTSTTLQGVVYSAGQTPLTALQESADGEFPFVANLLCDRHGRLCFRGRQARFDPVGTATAAGAEKWDYHDWKAGDGAAVSASPADTAHVRALSFERGVSKIINSATATENGASDAQIPGREVHNTPSINTYGLRSWSQTNLLTEHGDIDATYPTSAAVETKRFALFYIQNYAQPQNRIQSIGFRSLHPGDPRAPANWELLSKIDIGDTIEITVATAAGGGFHSEAYFVEGVHEDVKPLDPGYDDVTLTLDLSPRTYFTMNPWTHLTAPDTTPDPPPHPKQHTHKHAPKHHGGSHSYNTGPDPVPIAYDNVGIPIADLPPPDGGSSVDLTGYIHYDSVGGSNLGDRLKVETASTGDDSGVVLQNDTSGAVALTVIGSAASTAGDAPVFEVYSNAFSTPLLAVGPDGLTIMTPSIYSSHPVTLNVNLIVNGNADIAGNVQATGTAHHFNGDVFVAGTLSANHVESASGYS